jgi:hypothetical protein
VSIPVDLRFPPGISAQPHTKGKAVCMSRFDAALHWEHQQDMPAATERLLFTDGN